jgi:positive regulator of sigma E activity
VFIALLVSQNSIVLHSNRLIYIFRDIFIGLIMQFFKTLIILATIPLAFASAQSFVSIISLAPFKKRKKANDINISDI